MSLFFKNIVFGRRIIYSPLWMVYTSLPCTCRRANKNIGASGQPNKRLFTRIIYSRIASWIRSSSHRGVKTYQATVPSFHSISRELYWYKNRSLLEYWCTSMNEWDADKFIYAWWGHEAVPHETRPGFRLLENWARVARFIWTLAFFFIIHR